MNRDIKIYTRPNRENKYFIHYNITIIPIKNLSYE